MIEGNGEDWWNLPCKPHKGPNGSTLSGPCDSPVVEIYEDKDNARKDEIAALGGQGEFSSKKGMHGEDKVLTAFSERLKEVNVLIYFLRKLKIAYRLCRNHRESPFS